MIPWDKPKVYAYYAQQGWSKDDVDYEHLRGVLGGQHEPHRRSTRRRSWSTPSPTADDRVLLRSAGTPSSRRSTSTSCASSTRRVRRARTSWTSAGHAVAADLATSGEVDTYHFAVGNAATYIMTTEGPSDTVLTLHGPSDPGAVLAWDDDRGRGERPHRAQVGAGGVLAVGAAQESGGDRRLLRAGQRPPLKPSVPGTSVRAPVRNREARCPGARLASWSKLVRSSRATPTEISTDRWRHDEFGHQDGSAGG